MAGAISSSVSAETLPTALPMARVCWPPAVPVTTISSSEMAASVSASVRSSCPAWVVWLNARYPIITTSRVIA